MNGSQEALGSVQEFAIEAGDAFLQAGIYLATGLLAFIGFTAAARAGKETIKATNKVAKLIA